MSKEAKNFIIQAEAAKVLNVSMDYSQIEYRIFARQFKPRLFGWFLIWLRKLLYLIPGMKKWLMKKSYGG